MSRSTGPRHIIRRFHYTYRLPPCPWLRDGPCLPLDLERAFERTCREQRLTAEVGMHTG
jgi:hypothetical protein